MQPAEPRWCWKISAILFVWILLLLLWPDDVAEAGWHGGNRTEAPLRPSPRANIGRYPTGFT